MPGLALNHNLLAILLGGAIIICGAVGASLFQSKLFRRYRRKVPNTRVQKN